jgi:hypothetical protein
MKTAIALILFSVAISSTAQAQTFKRFRLATGPGFAIGGKVGICVYLEPGYRITDQVLVGLRMESAPLARGFSEQVNTASDFDIAGFGSCTLSGQYYFNNHTFRPFAGIGFGRYYLSRIGIVVAPRPHIVGKDEAKLGVYPRVGFDVGHFSLQLEYNFIPATKLEGLSVEFKNSYIGIRIGGFFGGGRKI